MKKLTVNEKRRRNTALTIVKTWIEETKEIKTRIGGDRT